MSNLAVVVQARTGSTRLPGKVLLPFGSTSLLGFQLDALVAEWGEQVVVATTTVAADDVVVEFCGERKQACFRGSEDDVLQRFIDAAEGAGASVVVRVCSDNPFLDPSSIHAMVDLLQRRDLDYCGYRLSNRRPSILTSIGFYAEACRLDALRRLAGMDVDAQFREHVTYYLYTHDEQFSVGWCDVPRGVETVMPRLTCDTPLDYDNLTQVLALCGGQRLPPQDVCARIAGEPALLQRMHQEDNRQRKG